MLAQELIKLIRVSAIYEAALAALSYQPDGGFSLEVHRTEQLLSKMEQAKPGLSAQDLQPVLKLIAVLEEKPETAAGAEALVQLLRRSPRAMAVLSASKAELKNRSRAARGRLSAFEGRSASLSAPTHDAPVPQGTLSARSLIRPIDSAEVRARR